MILAGGRGKRLGALSRHRPKPMLLIKGHPFLEYLLAWLRRYGLKDIIICSGYLSKLIEKYFGSGRDLGLKIKYVVEEKPLGTAGALRHARRYIDGDFVLLNGDTFIDINLKDMIAYHYKKNNKVTMAVTKMDNSKRYGKIQIDNYGRVISFNEKSKEGQLINAGLYICNSDLLKKLPQRGMASLERNVFPYLGKNWIGAYKTDSFFIDIGTVSDYCRFKAIAHKFYAH